MAKFSTRKGLAVGLAVLGVAGLSLASASQLQLSSAGTAQTGTVNLDAACQKSGPVTAKYATPTLVSATGYASSAVTLTNIDAACVGKTIRVAWKGTTGGYTELASKTLATADSTSGSTFSLGAVDYNTVASFAVSIDG